MCRQGFQTNLFLYQVVKHVAHGSFLLTILGLGCCRPDLLSGAHPDSRLGLPMKTLFCLGLHKTGSTSLQHFLLANQIQLGREGVLYPPVHPHGTARFLAEALGRRPSRPRAARLNEYMGHNALAHRFVADALPDYQFPPGHAPMPTGALVLDHISDLAQQIQAHTLIFCSEDLAKASALVPQTPDLFATHFGVEQAALFAIVRRPDDALSSWQSQMLKFRAPFDSLSTTGLAPWLKTVHLDYRAALAPWLERFPKAERHILPYDSVRTRGGAVAVFQETFAKDLPQTLVKTANSNTSLPYALIEIARLAMAAMPLTQAIRLRSYLTRAAPRLSLPVNRDVDLLGPAARSELAATFSDCHDWLGQVSGQRPFFKDLDDITRPRIFDARSAAAEIFPDLIQDAETHLPDPDLLTFLQKLYRDGP